MPSAAADGIVAEIAEAVRVGGPLRFDRYMELALYGRHGFYTGAGSAGRAGADFITSPEVGPLFGAVVARALDGWWDQLGQPDPFTVVEFGAGPGALAHSVLAATSTGGRCGSVLRYVAVERSAVQRARHRTGHIVVETVADAGLGGPFDGIVLANELLDNVPFRLLVFDGAWRESAIEVDRDGRLVEVLQALDERPEWLPATPAHGARIPWQIGAARWVDEARELVRRGRVVTFDYVTPRTAQLAITPWRQWLRTYRGHERGGHYLAAPGTQDITVQVALDQLPEPDALRSQAQFLERWGIDEFVDEGALRGRRPPLRPRSQRCGCAAACARPRRCSSPPASAASPSWSGPLVAEGDEPQVSGLRSGSGTGTVGGVGPTWRRDGPSGPVPSVVDLLIVPLVKHTEEHTDEHHHQPHPQPHQPRRS